MAEEYKFTWYDICEENPYNKRILDIRSLTQTMVSTTTNKSVAEMFNRQRHSIGEELIGCEIQGCQTINAELVYNHNGTKLAGATYKAEAMEDKWDIYGWNDVIYFTRSWTGELVYKAFINITETNLKIYKIEFSPNNYTQDDISIVVNTVHFLMMTLALKNVYPHKVPKTIIADKDIAIYSYSLFGRNSWYATYDNILDTVKRKKE